MNIHIKAKSFGLKPWRTQGSDQKSEREIQYRQGKATTQKQIQSLELVHDNIYFIYETNPAKPERQDLHDLGQQQDIL